MVSEVERDNSWCAKMVERRKGAVEGGNRSVGIAGDSLGVVFKEAAEANDE